MSEERYTITLPVTECAICGHQSAFNYSVLGAKGSGGKPHGARRHRLSDAAMGATCQDKGANPMTPSQLAERGIRICIGSEFEHRLADGMLKPLSDKEIAMSAYSVNGRLFAACQTWVKDYPGQVTGGRIGRPVVRFCPLDWHGSKQVARVKRRLDHIARVCAMLEVVDGPKPALCSDPMEGFEPHTFWPVCAPLHHTGPELRSRDLNPEP